MAKVIISLLCLIVLSFRLSECQQDYCYDEDCHYDATELMKKDRTSVSKDSMWNLFKDFGQKAIKGATNIVVGIANDAKNIVQPIGSAIWKALEKSWYFMKQIPEAVFGPVVNLTREALKDIEEIFRYVINDKVRYLILNISDATMKSLNQFIESNNILTGIGKKMLSWSILVVVLLLNYMLFHYFSLVNVLIFDIILYVLHHIYGPVTVVEWFITLCAMVYELLKWTISNPNLSVIGLSSFIALMFFKTCIWHFIRRDRLYGIDRRLQDMERQMERMEQNIVNIEKLLHQIKVKNDSESDKN